MTEQSTSTANPNGAAHKDAKEMGADIKGILERFSLPGFDLQGFLESRKADIDAVTQASSNAFTGAQTIVDKQAELLKTVIADIGDAFATVPEGSSAPATFISRQQELVNNALSSALTSIKDIAETARKSQSDIIELAAARTRSNVEELRALLKPAQPHDTVAK